jgi:SAM-dependent methyltransferase
MSIDAQTLGELQKARDAFAPDDRPLTAAILGDCAFTTPWATGDNRRDLAEFASRMNFSRVETLDVAGNPTIRADITGALPPGLAGTFDVVLDIGTLYWCFDVAAGWRNCLALLKPRGLIAHHSAMTGYFGRGYYTFQPRLFRDLYNSNQFREITVKTRTRKFFEETSLLRRFFMYLNPPRREFREAGPDEIFVNAADWRGFRFGNTVNPQAPMLPNDAEILCIASRDGVVAFMPPSLSSAGV